MIKKRMMNAIGLSLFVSIASSMTAKPWLPAIYGNNMVLQANQPLEFIGKSDPGNTVTVTIKDLAGTVIASGQTQVAQDKNWNLKLDSIDSGLTLTVEIDDQSEESVSFTNVLSGEVWLCSGQSNMRWPVRSANDADTEIAAADNPEIRLFSVKREEASKPLDDVQGEWGICSPETVADFSATGYFFGRKLHQALKQPVGLIFSAYGATPVQAWVPKDTLKSNPETAVLFDEFKAYIAQPDDQRAKNARGEWIYGAQYQKAPSRLYNAMIHPLIPYSLRGAIWYQGEANSREGQWGGPSLYSTLFPMLVESWRKAWGKDFPFIYVELANFMAPQQSPVDEEADVNWGYIREAQASILKLPNTYVATAIDIGETESIHPLNKQDVGARLALAALGGVYAIEDAPYLSPRYAGHTIEGSKVHIRFDNAEGGLMTNDGKMPNAFAVRGKEGPWYWAQTKIDGDEIIVWHSDVTEPVAVRHAWASNPDVNVYNRAKLPLMPFRTDKE